jgi:ubiquitin-conjugating enzyme E2 D
MSARRIQNELDTLKKESIECLSAGPRGENLFLWDAVLFGPSGSPYESGIFKMEIHFPLDYPFKAPKVVFLTKIYHPNISPQGNICLDILKDQWSPALTVVKVLLSISSLLTDANPKDPLVADAANLYLKDRDAFNQKAREWTQKYAR